MWEEHSSHIPWYFLEKSGSYLSFMIDFKCIDLTHQIPIIPAPQMLGRISVIMALLEMRGEIW